MDHERHALHGITVVIDTGKDALIAGRFHSIFEGAALLLDVEVHRDGDGNKSQQEWLAFAQKFGQWPREKQMRLPLNQIKSVRRLVDLSPATL
ncbi:MAG: hypothetical protein HPKKFMNG_01653 [Planctomycetes bacterium]|nr:hypothetical protein [Planctomycetota bacterium]HRJ77146.1 hypothetical protein [Planctomycetota bacterium]